jgi:hypothetical protein
MLLGLGIGRRIRMTVDALFCSILRQWQKWHWGVSRQLTFILAVTIRPRLAKFAVE